MPDAKDPIQQISVRVPKTQMDLYRQIAARQGRSLGGLFAYTMYVAFGYIGPSPSRIGASSRKR